MRTVLVTGATGAVGRHAVRALVARGWTVHAVSSKPTTSTPPPVIWHRADLLDLSHIAPLMRTIEPTHLLHLAWYVAPGRWASAPDNFLWVQASLEIVRQFHQAGGTRIVGAGS